MILQFTIPGDPVPKARPRVVNGHAYTPTKTKEYEDLVRLCYREAGGQKLEGAVTLEIWFEFEMPKSWSKKKKANMPGNGKTSKPDIDNLIKSILDGLNGEAWDDDAQVIGVHATKAWAAGESQTIVRFW